VRARGVVVPVCGRNIDARVHAGVVAAYPESGCGGARERAA
jgi:hypothetical protein